MANQILQELSREQIIVNKYEEAILSWHESYLTVLTEKGVHIYELSHNIQCLDKKIDYIQSLISHPKYSPAECLFTNKVVNKKLRNINQADMIVDHALWPHNMQLMQEMSVIVDFKWSPPGAVNNNGSAIAVLTNVGVVEIHTQNLFKWSCTIQISDLLSQECNIQSNLPHNFEQAKELAYMLATSAICWSPVNQDNCCYFVTAQKNGNIVFWLIESDQSNVTAKMVGTLQVESCEMQSMLWIPGQSDTFLLVCSNILGQIKIFECHLQNDVIELVQSYNIWTHKDKMISKYLDYVEVNTNIILFCNKNRHILVFLIDKNCNVLGQYINNINDHRITSICKTGEDVFITTVDCKIHKLNMITDGTKLNITLDPIQNHVLSPTHELYGLAYSPNKVLSAICVNDRKINSRKDTLKLEVIIASTIEKLDSLPELLLSNPTKLLTGYWDVIEALRYKCLKAKEVPAVNYDQLYEKAVADTYMLKLYNLLCIICHSLKKMFKIGNDFQLPESSSDLVKEEILVAHAEKLIHKFSTKFKEQGKLRPFEMEVLNGASKFLEYFFKKNNKNIIEVLDQNIMSLLDRNSSFICQACDEEVTGFKCKHEHLNMFCALTFTPIITNNYLVCKWCNLTARQELLSEKPLCLFCDLPLMCVD